LAIVHFFLRLAVLNTASANPYFLIMYLLIKKNPMIFDFSHLGWAISNTFLIF
jgi:hypothetical protein